MEKGKIEFADPAFRDFRELPDSQEKRFSEDEMRWSFHFMMDRIEDLEAKLAIAVEALEWIEQASSGSLVQAKANRHVWSKRNEGRRTACNFIGK